MAVKRVVPADILAKVMSGFCSSVAQIFYFVVLLYRVENIKNVDIISWSLTPFNLGHDWSFTLNECMGGEIYICKIYLKRNFNIFKKSQNSKLSIGL